MGETRMQTPARTLSGAEIRRLLVLRSRLRDAVVGLPRPAQRAILQALEEARLQREHGRPLSWSPPAMGTGELIREIKWRVDVAPLAELDAGVRTLERAMGRLSARRGDRTRRAPR
jgi:hypothetical protein